MTPPFPPSKKRRRFIVDRRFQLKYTALTAGAAAVFGATVLADYYGYYGRSVSSNLLEPGLFYLFLAANKILVLKLGLFLALFSAGAMLISFRIAGPFFNLRRCFRDAAEGLLTARVRFRDRDEFHDVADEFNRMMGELQKKVAEDRRSAQEMSEALDVLAGAPLTPDQKKIVDELRRKTGGLTQGFRL
jgi:methyl-accepting chemotaxis protein